MEAPPLGGRGGRPPEWVGRRVLVTGYTGFLGSRLCQELVRRGALVSGLAPGSSTASERDDTNGAGAVTRVAGRVQDEAGLARLVDEHRPQVVFHLAARARTAEAVDAPALTLDTNVRGTWCLLEACRRVGGVESVLVASSAAVYGPTERPATEHDALVGQGLYEVSKACADALARAFARTHGLPVAVVRSVNLYGPGDLDWSRLIPGTIRSVWGGGIPALRSDGTPRAEYLHVDDAVHGWLELAAAMADPSVRGAFNFGTGAPSSVLDVVREVLEVMGSPDLEPQLAGTAASGGGDRIVDSSRAREHFGWAPRRTLRQGLVDTVAWYTRYLSSRAECDGGVRSSDGERRESSAQGT